MSAGRSRVVTLAPMPPEKCAYALARYSRSPDSIRDSVRWVREHDSAKFLEHFYFQYGHASIADLGHTVLCFEGISELAATEIEDEPLWDGQAKSSRYQDFSRTPAVVPEEFGPEAARAYAAACDELLAAYRAVHSGTTALLRERLPRPAQMDPEAYERNIAARAFDVARYLLFPGIPTNVGQVASIRTLEKQIRRLKASPYAELQSLAREIAAACAAAPDCIWDPAAPAEPLCPTLARHVGTDEHLLQARQDLRLWAEQNLPPAAAPLPGSSVDLVRPVNVPADIAATLLYPATTRPFRELYEMACEWSAARRNEVIDVALRSRTRRDEMLRGFRGGLFAYDIVMDIGAWRDLHRHRRCQQFRQPFTTALGYETPELLAGTEMERRYTAAVESAFRAARQLPAPGGDYILPFATRSRFLFKMDFAEADYIARLRSGVKGHFSYRRVAWEMKRKMDEVEPELGRLIEATPPWVEDPLER